MAEFKNIQLNEADRLLPSANVIRIMRHSLPEGCKISSEVKERMLEVTSELIGFVTNHSVEEYMLKAKRKTLLDKDVLNALNDLDLNMFLPPLNAYLHQKRKQKSSQTKKNKNKDQNTNNAQQTNSLQTEL